MREEMVGAMETVACVVSVPVTADVEGGYSPDPSDDAATVDAVVAAGAVGINLDDSTAAGGPLFTPEEQAQRIEGAVRAAAAAGVPDLVVNARTDVFLFAIGEESTRLDDVLARAAV